MSKFAGLNTAQHGFEQLMPDFGGTKRAYERKSWTAILGDEALNESAQTATRSTDYSPASPGPRRAQTRGARRLRQPPQMCECRSRHRARFK
jgi:hypothetical protein